MKVATSNSRLAWIHAARTSAEPSRLLLTGLLVAAGYYAGAQVGFALQYPGSPLSVIWPPNAIVLAALLLVPPRVWWVVLLAVLPAHLVVEAQNGVLTWTVIGLYFTNCAEAVLGAAGVRRFAGGPPWFGTLRAMLVFFAFAAVAAPFVTSFLDVSIVVVTKWGTTQDYWLLWGERFVSNMLTCLTVTPVIVIGANAALKRMQAAPPRRYVEAALVALGILASGYLLFNTPIFAATGLPALLYLPLPFLLWAAVRFGVGGAVAALLGFTLLSSTWAAASGAPAVEIVARSPADAVLTLQVFLLALSMPVLLLAALMQERERAEADLHESEERYRTIVSNLPGGFAAIFDADLRFVLADGPGLSVPKERLEGRTIQEVFSPDTCAVLEPAMRSALKGKLSSLEVSLGGRWYLKQCVPLRRGTETAGLDVTFDVTDRRRAEDALAQLSARLLQLQDEERRRIARELHDGLAQSLVAINLNLDRLRGILPDTTSTKAQRILAESQELTEQSLREIRTLSYLLHPPALDEAGLLPALEWYVEGFAKRSGVTVETVVQPEDMVRLPPEVEITLFRIVQEALANVHRHSGSKTARVELRHETAEVTLHVEDCGHGLPTAERGHGGAEDDLRSLGVGILGMRQRVRQLGGRLDIESSPRGTLLSVTLPVSGEGKP